MHAPQHRSLHRSFSHPQALHPLVGAMLAAFCGTALAQTPAPAAPTQTLGEVTVQSTSDDDGYVYITADDLPDGANTSGRFYLRELEAAPGYTLDKQYKTVYVSPGKTVEIEWENTAVTGQIEPAARLQRPWRGATVSRSMRVVPFTISLRVPSTGLFLYWS
mgnify:CR=1 FL=1